MRAPRTLSVLIPAYNEFKNLAPAVEDVLATALDLDDLEVLIVDDGSTDGTGPLADDLAREYPQVRALHHQGNLGFVAAYGTALAEARMTYFTFVPGDHEVAPESVRNIFAEIGLADLVVPYHATPWRRTWFRRLLTWVCTTEVNVLFGWRMQYYQGPVVYPTALARALPREARGFFFATEMLVHALDAGYTFKEVGLTHQDRAYGRSKAVALSNIVDAERTILRLWWSIRVLRRRVTPRAPSRETASDNVLEGIQL
jgi:glycosyltransferase involved in cell wall biosynthesis